MRRLLPPSPTEEPGHDVDLDEVYAWPDRCVRGLMVASVDGRTTVNGASEPLSGRADRRVLSLLRGTCDVVLCGAGTVRAEGWHPPRPSPARRAWRAQRGMPEVPVYAVASRSGSVPSDDTEGDVLVLDGTPDEALDELSRRGLTRVLCEGGPTLLAAVASAGRLDELCLTISPLLTGPGSLGLLEGAPWPATVPVSLVSLLEQDGFLFGRWAVG
ncbi:MAG: dihydrofolate reductase family protein [Actinomycetes bacterium]